MRLSTVNGARNPQYFFRSIILVFIPDIIFQSKINKLCQSKFTWTMDMANLKNVITHIVDRIKSFGL